MRFFRRIRRDLSEYLLGTETKKRFNYEREYWRKRLTNSQKMLTSLDRQERSIIHYGKYFPNLMTSTGVIFSAVLWSPIPLSMCIYGEFVRSAYHFVNVRNQKESEKSIKFVNAMYSLLERMGEVSKKESDSKKSDDSE